MRGFDQIGRAARAQYLREGRERIAMERRVESEKIRGIRRTEAEAHRAAQRRHHEEERATRRLASTRMRAAERWGGRGASALGNAGRNVVGMGGSALALVGGVSAYNAVSSGMALDERSRRIVIGAGKGNKRTPEEVQAAIEKTAIETGINPEKLAEGMQAAMDKTGDLESALKNLNTVAVVAQATGGDATDAYLLQADAMQKFGLSAEESRAAMATLIEQGKKGAFTFKNMATLAPKAFAGAAAFGMKGQAGLAQIGGLLQVNRNVTGSDEQAAFATEALLRQLQAKGGDMQSGKAFGGRKVEVFRGGDARKGANNFRDILGGVLSASEGNVEQLYDVFGEEGIKSIRPFLTKFRDTREGALAGGASRKDANAAGAAAALKILDEATNVSSDFADVQRDAADAMKALSVQLEVVNTRVKSAIAKGLLPSIERMIPQMEKLVPVVGQAAEKFGEALKFLADDPWKGVGILVGAAIAKEIAVAGVGKTVEAALAAAIRRMGGGAPIPGGAPVPGAPGGVGLAPGLAAGAALAGVGLAVNQAGKLQEELGVKGSFLDGLPGFKGGSFSADQLMSDTMTPWDPAKRLGDTAARTIMGIHDVGKPESEKWVKTMGKGVGEQGQGAGAAAIDTKPLMDAGAALAKSAEALTQAATDMRVAANSRTSPILTR